MRLLTLSVPILLTVAAAPGVRAQQVPAPPTLPAAFYDVDVREQLGFAPDAAPSQSYVVRIAGRAIPPVGAAHSVQSSSMLADFRGATRFIVAQDSLLFRNGRYFAEIAINTIIAVEEFRRPERNQNSWIRIRYVARGEERQLFVRRTGTRNQDQILGALREAIERDRAAHARESR